MAVEATAWKRNRPARRSRTVSSRGTKVPPSASQYQTLEPWRCTGHRSRSTPWHSPLRFWTNNGDRSARASKRCLTEAVRCRNRDNRSWGIDPAATEPGAAEASSAGLRGERKTPAPANRPGSIRLVRVVSKFRRESSRYAGCMRREFPPDPARSRSQCPTHSLTSSRVSSVIHDSVFRDCMANRPKHSHATNGCEEPKRGTRAVSPVAVPKASIERSF